MQDPSKFTPHTVLSSNPSEKRIVILGSSSQPCGSLQQGKSEGILVINSKTPTPQSLHYKKIEKIFQNDIYSRFDVTMEGQYEIQAIYPVTQKHIKKYRAKKMVLMVQSAEDYKKGQKELLEKQLGHLGWVDNIINGTAQADRVLYRCQEFLILPDFKFSNIKQIENLHLLVIFCDRNLHSIRDLTGGQIKLLQDCQQQVNKVLIETFGLQRGRCRMFFHYPPTFYQLHLHVTILGSSAANALVERAHLLQNVISNLTVCSQYYEKVDLAKTIEKDI